MKTQKRIWSKFKDITGYIFGLISCAWWFGVTPEMVGQLAYDVGYTVTPFILLSSGILIGWQLKRAIMARHGITLDSIQALEKEQEQLKKVLQDKEDAPDVERFRMISTGMKAIVALISNAGYLDAEWDWLTRLEDTHLLDMHLDEDGEDFEWLISRERLPQGYRYRLTVDAERLLNCHPDLLGPTKESLKNGFNCREGLFSSIEDHNITFDSKAWFRYHNDNMQELEEFDSTRNSILFDLAKEAEGDRRHVFTRPLWVGTLLIEENMVASFKEMSDDSCRFVLNSWGYKIAESLQE